MSQKTELPHQVEEWTREHVHYWLTQVINVDKKHADKLYEEEVSGEELACYQPKHLQEVGIKHGPAVKIITRFNELKTLNDNESDSESSEHCQTQKTKAMQDTTVEVKGNVLTDQTPTSKIKSGKTRKSKRRRKKSMDSPPKLEEALMDNTTPRRNPLEETQPKDLLQMASSQKNLAGSSSRQSSKTEQKESVNPKTLVTVDKHEACQNKKIILDPLPLRHSCSLFPFDQNSASHRYIQNYTLPPETGPGNLIDPVHEYKFMGRTDDIHVMKKKFNKETFRFAAGCMNARTNGTIHFGVADSKDTEYVHGEIIGVSVENRDIIIDHFNQGMKSYFEGHTDEANACIRQPRFVELLCPDGKLSGKYVIEVDVVPSHSVVQGKLFYIQTLDEDNQWKKSKGNSLFVREGAATRDICKIGNPKELQSEMAKKNKQMNALDNRRRQAEKRPESKTTSNQGEKLKNLLAFGGNRLGYYDYYIIVTNKSHDEQLQHLQFMTTLKLFCVLDFDPNSAVSGTCHSYTKVRIANLHNPRQLLGDPGTVAKDLNLYKQTSWVFCNGREDLSNESDMPLRPSDWLTNKAGEVQDVISFLCNSDTLPRGRFLVIFLLLSTVEAMNDPIFDTFMSFYKNIGGAEGILSICTSDTSFQKWRDFIQARCEHDISQRSIYDLELSEINGTILKLGQNKSTAERLLPSAEGSSVVLQKRDEDLTPSLDVLCENECENEFDEDSEEFKEFKLKTEAEFYRGDKVKWWNFYFSEKSTGSQFIKRDKYDTLKRMIESKAKNPTSTCVMLNLFHQPGCGGTTLAMHVMWSLRKDFRCAVLKDNTVSKLNVAQEVVYLVRCGKTETSRITPALLLVDDSEETENTEELQHCTRKILDEICPSALVVILNCLRSNNPKVRWSSSVIESQFMTATLSKEEQDAFETKLKELQETHEKPENFYSFMIMKSNFSQEYVTNVARNILKDLDIESKQAQLLSILALLNSYVADSAISVSLCEDFLGINMTLRWKKTVMEEMQPQSCLLIEVEAECGMHKAIRFVHQQIAKECVNELEKTHNSPRSDIVSNLLHCDLFFKRGIGKDQLLQSMKNMLITRQRKTEGDEKDTLFSPLIEDINQNDGLKKIQDIFTEASKRFDKDFAIPQALARHFYLKEKNFAQAKDWANKAKTIKESSYTLDTVGQVSRSELKHKIDNKKQSKHITTDDLKEYLDLAKDAINAFQRAQVLAMTDDVHEETRKSRTYNISGYMSEIDIAMTVFGFVKGLPLFDERDSMKDYYIQQFFKGKISITSIPINQSDANNKMLNVLKDNETFLVSLRTQVDKAFEFLEIFFTYTREKGIVDKEKQLKNRTKLSEHFKNYIHLFCPSSEEKISEKKHKPKLSMNMEIEECRMFLEETRANNFPRILQFLEFRKNMIEQIVEKHSFIYKNCTKSLKDKTNHLLAHIILKLNKPKSPLAKLPKELIGLLKEILQEAGTQHQHPEPYYLALLLLWPGNDPPDTRITTYAGMIKKSSKKQLLHIFRVRNPIAHFYLGKADGLERLLPKSALDSDFSNLRDRNVLWQNADIFKEQAIKDKLLRVHGTIEEGELYAEYGKLKIPVRPTYLGGIRSGHSTERVTFYVGFAIDGPLAYDVQYADR
ncbi:sterile alpha motif domain-containing protein 9-like [Triplophysa rosa]|uniref:Sterile alpha motif domain-containing protein 9-like n=1 Tax=Triplophysa rosa TaxID=992332 RepID=A0A9W7WS86_TRIRA|nr:sterile alpha motif domain-containing protein 9-like [Triplophysa rosa]XP_057193445.1 sterile alpha motif domain-containing protein 9-like [Triplophysa rosa]XP_057193446.1 sterile alpha motif domain-containing protein 9-like [Triplophysa rosa]KAI7807318.1 putative sterile alpha motif domain-containing protein 9-like [Triplophysa rosa]